MNQYIKILTFLCSVSRALFYRGISFGSMSTLGLSSGLLKSGLPPYLSAVVLGALLFTPMANARDCVESTPGLSAMSRATITILNDDGRPIEASVLVADDAFERAAGFQSICPQVIEETLILFRYPVAIEGKFHMQNVHAPLDIVFFDAKGRFIQYVKMETYTKTSQPLYGPGRPFQYALEAPVGFFAEHKISAYPSQLLLKY